MCVIWVPHALIFTSTDMIIFWPKSLRTDSPRLSLQSRPQRVKLCPCALKECMCVCVRMSM